MNNSKEFLKQNQIRPRLSFKGGEAKTVVLLKDRVDKITDQNGKEVNGVRYLVKENGEEKTFFTGSIGLIQKLSEFNENDQVVIQMKSRKGENGGFVSYYEVSRAGSPVPSLSSENADPEEVAELAVDELSF